MKLLFVTTHLFPDTQYGGVVHSGQALGLELQRLLQEVSYVCVSQDPRRVQEQNGLQPECLQTSAVPRWGYAPGLRRRLDQLIPAADVVFINGITTYPTVQAARACRQAGKPFVVAPRGGLVPGNTRIKPLRKWFYHRLVDRPNLRRASAIVGTSELELACIARLGVQTPLVLIPNGANLPESGDGLPGDLPPPLQEWPRDVPVVLFMGRLHPYKNLDVLLDAWAQVCTAAEIPPGKLVLAGAEDQRGYRAHLEKRARLLGITDRLLFAGEVTGAAKWALLRRATCLVLPSHSENFGMVVLEALACRTPVVASTGTPWQELETHQAGFWVAPEKDDIARGIRRLIGLAPEERREWGARGEKLARERYAWPVIARKLLRVLHQAATGGPIPRDPDAVPVDDSGRAMLAGPQDENRC